LVALDIFDFWFLAVHLIAFPRPIGGVNWLSPLPMAGALMFAFLELHHLNIFHKSGLLPWSSHRQKWDFNLEFAKTKCKNKGQTNSKP